MTPQMPCLKLTPGRGPQCPQQLRSALEVKLSRLGYGRICFIEEGADLLVTARKGDLVLGAVYDVPSGALMAQNTWQAGGAGDPDLLAG
ncbi:hypothetical protein [Leisingera sp. S232]|uniref:hypothetical protein n=1 Tax=Leisingera sp. S232 TaxID=3415132 RepID=UPI0008692920|nr:hypothetical protein AB838_07050 [Rhodobacteraceae bacterium (ex Bugula neritina AB1)]